MIPLTCVAQAHLVNPKTGKLSALMTNRCAGFYAFTQRALRSYGSVAPLAPFSSRGAGGGNSGI